MPNKGCPNEGKFVVKIFCPIFFVKHYLIQLTIINIVHFIKILFNETNVAKIFLKFNFHNFDMFWNNLYFEQIYLKKIIFLAAFNIIVHKKLIATDFYFIYNFSKTL